MHLQYRVLGLSLGLATSFFVAPRHAEASCIPAPLEVKWSYPSEGMHDVPVDATLWVLMGGSTDTAFTLNGATVEATDVTYAGRRIDPGVLEANTDYVLAVWDRDELPDDEDAGANGVIEIKFRTGSGKRGAGPLKTTVNGQTLTDDRDGASVPACVRDLFDAQGCLDTGPRVRHAFDVSASGDVIAWLVTPDDDNVYEKSALWPVGCEGPQLSLGGPYCYEISAIGEGGVLGEPARICDDGVDAGVEPSTNGAEPVTVEDRDASACAVIRVGDPGAWRWVGLAYGLALAGSALRRRRARR